MHCRPVFVALGRHDETGVAFLLLGERPDKAAEPVGAIELHHVVRSRTARAVEEEHERIAASRLDAGPEEPVGHNLA